MRHLEHPNFEWFETQHLRFLHKTLTEDWWRIQGGAGIESLELWLQIFRVLELDRKSQRDLLLLAQSGLVGRTMANKTLWELCSHWALDPTYEDLSHKCTSLVGWARRTFDRPPRGHEDLEWWTWSAYDEPRLHARFSPMNVPRDAERRLVMGPGGLPLAPPDCWGPQLQ